MMTRHYVDIGEEMPERDEESGKFEAAVESAADFLEAMEPGEQYRTTELAERVGIERTACYKYLDELVEAGDVEKIEVHSNLVLWERPADPVTDTMQRVREQAEEIDQGGDDGE